MTINNVAELVDASTQGNTQTYTWRKVPSQTVTTGVWFDLSMSPGMPAPQYYAATPLKATAMSFSSDRGIFHGYDVSPATKHVSKVSAMGVTFAAATPLYLLDYLMYYPFVDEGVLDPQVMDNTVTLPRYSDGAGVQMMAVSQGARTGLQTFVVNYTNSDGVAGRTSRTISVNTAPSNGHILNASFTGVSNGTGPFIGLQAGDTGVRSVESVTQLSSDVGLFAIVLVKPLATTIIRGLTAINEVDLFLQSNVLPEIKNDAYLNWICLPGGNMNANVFMGELTTLWK